MKISIPVGPLSVNKSLTALRRKSIWYKKFEYDVNLFLPTPPKTVYEGELIVKYEFYVKNYGHADVDNMIKSLQDILVNAGFIRDDRYIKQIHATKYRVESTEKERMDIDIQPYKTDNKNNG